MSLDCQLPANQQQPDKLTSFGASRSSAEKWLRFMFIFVLPATAYLTFVTNITNVVCGDKFQISIHDKCGEI